MIPGAGSMKIGLGYMCWYEDLCVREGMGRREAKYEGGSRKERIRKWGCVGGGRNNSRARERSGIVGGH